MTEIVHGAVIAIPNKPIQTICRTPSLCQNKYSAASETAIDMTIRLRRPIRSANGPLKMVGEHTVTVAPHTDVVVEVKVVVVGETD